MAHHSGTAQVSGPAHFEGELGSKLGGPTGVSRDICTGGSSDTGGNEQAEQASEFSAVVEGIEGLERDGRHQRFQEEATASLNILALRLRCYQPVMAGAALRKRRTGRAASPSTLVAPRA